MITVKPGLNLKYCKSVVAGAIKLREEFGDHDKMVPTWDNVFDNGIPSCYSDVISILNEHIENCEGGFADEDEATLFVGIPSRKQRGVEHARQRQGCLDGIARM